MDWTLEENMVDGLLFCATLTGYRGGHTQSVQAGSDSVTRVSESTRLDSSHDFW